MATRGEFVSEILAIWDEIAKLFPELEREHGIAVEWLTKTYLTAELEQPVGAGNIFRPRPDLLNSREDL